MTKESCKCQNPLDNYPPKYQNFTTNLAKKADLALVHSKLERDRINIKQVTVKTTEATKEVVQSIKTHHNLNQIRK